MQWLVGDGGPELLSRAGVVDRLFAPPRPRRPAARSPSGSAPPKAVGRRPGGRRRRRRSVRRDGRRRREARRREEHHVEVHPLDQRPGAEARRRRSAASSARRARCSNPLTCRPQRSRARGRSRPLPIARRGAQATARAAGRRFPTRARLDHPRRLRSRARSAQEEIPPTQFLSAGTGPQRTRSR